MSEIAEVDEPKEESGEGDMHDALAEAFDDSVAQQTSEAETGETGETGTVIDSPPGDAGVSDAPQEPAKANAPQSWGVAEREGFSGLSPEIQTQINKRESEIQQALTHSGEARKFQTEFNEAVTPYLGFIQAEGGTPMTAFTNLMQTAATLQAGAPQQKAQRIAELIGHYGIDIQVLDSLLAGEAPQDTNETRFAQMLDQRLQPMMQTLNQFQQSQNQQNQNNAQNTNNQITEFMGQNEFATDLRFEMADLMEMAGKRGVAMDLPQAYEKALLLRPDIQQVIQQRTAGAAAQQNSEGIAAKERAAVSVRGGGDPTVGGVKNPSSMRAAIEQAMES